MEERRLRASGDENLRIGRMFDDCPDEGVGGRARMEVIDREDATREILPEDRDHLDRVVRRARDGGLEPSAVLVGEEVGERTQEAVCIVVGVHAPQELRPAFVREGPREERGLPDPGDANEDGNGPRVGGEPSLQDAKLVLAAEERPARDRGRLGGSGRGTSTTSEARIRWTASASRRPAWRNASIASAPS